MSDLRKEVEDALKEGEIYDRFGARWGEKRITILRAALALSQPALEPEPEYVDGYLIPYWLRDEPVGGGK